MNKLSVLIFLTFIFLNSYSVSAQNEMKQLQQSIKEKSEKPRFLLGTYPVELFKNGTNRNLGGFVGVIAGTSMTLISYTKVQNDPYQMFDLFYKDISTDGFKPKWDGNRFDFFFRNSDDVFKMRKLSFYHGLHFCYEQENLKPFKSEVIDKATETSSTETFSPIDRSFRVHFNPGATYYWGFIGFDLNLSIGVYLNSFQLNNDNYTMTEAYQFGNPLLENRNEGTLHYGPSVRLNFSTYLFF